MLTAAAATITIFAQHAGGAIITFERISLPVRFANALLSYLGYLFKTVWPIGLAVYYPHPETTGLISLGVAAVVLTALSFFAIYAHRARPFLCVGWFWFLGILVPVIGIVQVGGQAMADRYSYVPQIGIFIIAIWTAADIAQQHPHFARAIPAFVILLMLALSSITFRQTQFWQNDTTLFGHALAVTKDNWMMEENLGRVLSWDGRHEAAIKHHRRAVFLRPSVAASHFSLATELLETGQLEEAEQQFRAAIHLKPLYFEAYNNLASCLARQGRLREAQAAFRTAVSIQPRRISN